MVNGLRLARLDSAVPRGISTFLSRGESVADAELAMMLQVLDEFERRRAENFRFTKDSTDYTIAHFALRRVLADALVCNPKDIRFSRGPHGKPELHPVHHSDLRFNLSHSGDVSLIALAHEFEVGVDIERIYLPDGASEIAQQYFGEHVAQQLETLAPVECARAFSTLWVRFEALTKAKGTGIISGARLPDSPFPISFASGHPVIVDGWTISQLAVPDLYVAAIAFPDAPIRLGPDDHI